MVEGDRSGRGARGWGALFDDSAPPGGAGASGCARGRMTRRGNSEPSEGEIAGAYGALERARASEASKSARGGKRAPTGRVGALVRALGATVSKDEREILKRCETIADPTGSGTFELKKVRLGISLGDARL